ncbi:uncharacterized protein VTP21DRAFT_188 [Calcarisporiella thermophila]|uniref:uncharacterized protein n=1 Tax=Calcarisporiella thermophila TaxID=911321 RepID=UPI003744127A
MTAYYELSDDVTLAFEKEEKREFDKQVEDLIQQLDSVRISPPIPNSKDVHELVVALYTIANSSGSKRKRNVTPHEYQLSNGYTIVSWKMNEFQYRKDPPPFPTLARGLFTRKNEEGKHEIVARGYDKFFNIGEVKKTQWDWIEKNTAGTYEITVKENGCIIFLAGLPDGELLVTSKHSVGQLENVKVSHSQKGAEWVGRHLELAGKTRRQLAKFLSEYNITAVAELCDDDFEEHVLPYPKERRGLYLHGINYNTTDMRTWPSDAVARVAKYFGFLTVKCIRKETLNQTRKFLDDIAREGSLDGRDIEGFVVRCRELDTNSDFFFKVKFEEPYLMYREWREITKAILGGREFRSTYPASAHYATWVKKTLTKNPGLFEEYKQNRGIIRVRDMFLEYAQKNRVNLGESNKEQDDGHNFDKTLILTVATPGCGKTTISLALAEIFGFGHIQNDNIPGKKPMRNFCKAILEEFSGKNVVIADKNNHTHQLRRDLIMSIREKIKQLRIIALYWSHEEKPAEEIAQKTLERIRRRGENHQSLTPGSNANYSEVVFNFLHSFEPFDRDMMGDRQIHHLIKLDPTDSLEHMLDTALDGLSVLDLKQPTDEQKQKALRKAQGYTPTTKKVVASAKTKKIPRYFGISLEFNLIEWLSSYLTKHPLPPGALATFNYLRDNKLFPPTHHITLVHSMDIEREIDPKLKKHKQELWDKFSSVTKNGDVAARKVKFRFKELVVSSQLITLTVHDIDPPSCESSNRVPHVTVGTLSNIKAVESKLLLERLEDEEKIGDVWRIDIKEDEYHIGMICGYY